jgi:hypothetical protein
VNVYTRLRVEQDAPIYARLVDALTASFGAPTRYADFITWKLGADSKVHIYCALDRCDLWVSGHGSRSPRLLLSVSRDDSVPRAIMALRTFAEDGDRRAARDGE